MRNGFLDIEVTNMERAGPRAISAYPTAASTVISKQTLDRESPESQEDVDDWVNYILGSS